VHFHLYQAELVDFPVVLSTVVCSVRTSDLSVKVLAPPSSVRPEIKTLGKTRWHLFQPQVLKKRLRKQMTSLPR